VRILPTYVGEVTNKLLLWRRVMAPPVLLFALEESLSEVIKSTGPTSPPDPKPTPNRIFTNSSTSSQLTAAF